MISRETRLALCRYLILVFLVGSGLVAQAQSSYSIRINIPARRLDLLDHDRVVKEYPVAIGKSTTPSVLGRFHIINKVVDPTWYPEGGVPVVPGPDNPVGSRWLGLSAPSIGIHGTNNPASIGQAISGGCFRMHNYDVEQLFELVKIGTPVELVYEPVEVTRLPGKLSPVVIRSHPDIYRRGRKSLEELHDLIRLAGYGGEIASGELAELVKLTDGKARTFPARYVAELNGITFDFDLTVELGQLRIDGLKLARLLGVERTGLAALAYLLEYGRSITPEVAARLFGLAVSLDLDHGRLKFTAPFIRADNGQTSVAKIAADGSVLVPASEPYTILLAAAERVYPRMVVTLNGRRIPNGGYLIGDLVWVDLELAAGAKLNFAYQWSAETGLLVINGKTVEPVIAMNRRPLVPLAALKEILEPGFAAPVPFF